MKQRLWLIFLYLIPMGLLAQTGTITGTLTDASTDEGLAFANIFNLTTTIGTVTDLDGNYEILASVGDILEMSYVGYESAKATVTGIEKMNFALNSSSALLNEVVVIGYGSSTKKEITGAVSIVKAEEVAKLNPNRLEQALQGQSAGVQISSQSGSPGGGYNIRIRGISTNGDNNPLILVDGVRYADLSALDPYSIESINILKDASASIYGVQAANGVVLITTKKGTKSDKPVIDFHAYVGTQSSARRIPVLNATEYAILSNEAHANGGQTPPFNVISDLGEGTDWQDEVFQNAPIRNYFLNVRGGGDRARYAIGGSYFDQQGIVGGEKAGFKRYTGNVNLDVDLSEKLKFNSVVTYAKQNRKTLSENAIGSVLFNALNMPSTLTPFDEDGDYTLAEGLGAEVINPLQQIANTFNNVDVNRFSGTAGLSYNIAEGLTFTSSLPFNFSLVTNRGFSPIEFYGSGKVFNTVESSVSESTQTYSSWGWDNVLNYTYAYDNVHKIDVTAGTSMYEENFQGVYATGFGVPNNSFEFAAVSQANEIRPGGASSGAGTFRLMSQFGRIQYGYNYKYLISGIIRRDGTTRFGPNNRYGIFPSISVGWVMSEESFLQNNNIIDFAKLRLSYGQTGNDKIGDFRYVAGLNGESEYVFDGNTLVFGQAVGAIANPDINWERNTQFNAGLDLNLFGEALTVTADYFIKESNDLLLSIPVSGITGYTAPGGGLPIANAGSIKNTGIELAINYRYDFSEDISFNFGVNGSKLKNETTSLNDGVSFIQGGGFSIGQLPPTRWEVGQPIGYFYGLETDGVFQNASEIESHASQPDALPGDLKFVDRNNDGAIDSEDRTFIGSPIPEYIFGMSFSAEIHGFDFSAFADAQVGRDLVRNYARNLPLTNRTAYSVDRWHGEGTSTNVPRLTTGATDNNLFSDYFIEDGSYLRIKTLQLGYTIPRYGIQSIGFEKIRIYGSVSNPFTLTKYQGYDPNISSGNPLDSGIDNGYYPQARTFIAGIKITL